MKFQENPYFIVTKKKKKYNRIKFKNKISLALYMNFIHDIVNYDI